MKTPTKLELRKARLEVLAEINHLDKDRCDLCIPDNGFSETEKSHCECDAAIKIRALGDKLNTFVSKSKSADSRVIVMPDITGLTLETLTVEMYEKMKLSKMTDYQIRKHLGTGTNTIHEMER